MFEHSSNCAFYMICHEPEKNMFGKNLRMIFAYLEMARISPAELSEITLPNVNRINNNLC